MQNMKDIEWNISRLADATILGQSERESLKSALWILGVLRQTHSLAPQSTTAEDVVAALHAQQQ